MITLPTEGKVGDVIEGPVIYIMGDSPSQHSKQNRSEEISKLPQEKVSGTIINC